MKTQTFILICDLRDDEEAIQAYVECHKAVAPEILESIRVAGIVQMSIYRWQNRLTMILVGDEDFTFEKKAALDNANEKVQEWESFLGQYQTNLPGTPDNWRWQLMEKIFDFKA
ncbi:L-rhamnose mutarotase [Algoriphagus yeomjeoni]|uniref:L-rhamnose mutarotase n=1 Tax=Algoriphagus yeomjeoni TaxID=291403 RepID=A0A327NUJ3_9BACT|nr:L-rhamnose mutarotase [Algoriphagus yeomjeoni]RAI83660.1 L-rhamnose mutarotase [Algoriphagus yeomjeoni]